MIMSITAQPHFPEDVIDHLADIAAGSALDQVRRHRSEARSQAQQSFAALFTPAEPVAGAVSLRERLTLAAFTAGLHGEPRSTAFYTLALAAEDADLVFSISRALANSARWPQWHEGSEFRAIRQQSRKAGAAPR